jgi:hypothetical protein
MKTIRTSAFGFAIAALLSGCIIQSDDSSVFQHITLHDGSIAVHAHGVPDANVTPAGDLSINGKAVTVTADQRDLLKQYYAQVVAIRDDGIATGKAGAAMAGHAIGSVASGLAHGNPDSIGPAIESRAKGVEAKAMVVCNDLAALRTKQDVIASVLPAFKPYATIELNEVSDCRSQ